jgi:transposase
MTIYKKLPRKPISDAVRHSIIVLLQHNQCIKDICKIFGVSHSSVRRISKHPFKTKSSTTKTTGRPSKTSNEVDDFILSTSEKNRLLLPTEIKKMVQERFGVTISESSIKRRLVKDGLNGGVCVRKPLLSKINKLKRLIWAIKYRKCARRMPKNWKIRVTSLC